MSRGTRESQNEDTGSYPMCDAFARAALGDADVVKSLLAPGAYLFARNAAFTKVASADSSIQSYNDHFRAGELIGVLPAGNLPIGWNPFEVLLADEAPSVMRAAGTLVGHALVQRNGVAIALNSGETVVQGDQILSGSAGTGRILLADGRSIGLTDQAGLRDVLVALSEGNLVEDALAKMVAASADQALQLGSARSDVDEAAGIFKFVFGAELSRGLLVDAAYRLAEAAFWSHIHVQKERVGLLTNEQQLLASLAGGVHLDAALSAMLSQNPSIDVKVFETALSLGLASGMPPAQAAAQAGNIAAQIAQAQTTAASSVAVQLAWALASGQNVGVAVSAAGGNADNASFQAALSTNLAAGVAPDQAMAAAAATAAQVSQAQAAAASSPTAQLASALATGQNVGAAISAAGGNADGASFQAALSANLAAGVAPGQAMAAAAVTAAQVSQAQAAAASSPAAQLASALATGQNVGEAVSAAGGNADGASFQAALSAILAAGASPAQALAAATATGMQMAQAQAAGAASNAALASGLPSGPAAFSKGSIGSTASTAAAGTGDAGAASETESTGVIGNASSIAPPASSAASVFSSKASDPQPPTAQTPASDPNGAGAPQAVVLPAVMFVVPPNAAPVNTVPLAQTVNEDTNLSITELSVSDADAGGASIVTTLSVLHGTLTVSPAGGAAVSGNGTASVTLTGSQGQINTTLAAANNVVYRSAQDYNGADTLTMTTDDGGNTGSGGALSDTDTVAITVAPVNDAPVNTVPAAQTVAEDTNLSVTGLSVSDVDAGSASITATLSVLHGTVTIASAGGAAVSGSGTANVTLTGSQSQINTTLTAANNVIYRGTQDYNGGDTLTITTDDGGNTGSGGTLTGTDTVAITITPVNDAPVANITPTNYNATEQTSLTLKGTGLSISDLDAGSGSMSVTLTVTEGTLSAVAGDSGVTVSNSGTSSLTVTGTVSQVNTFLGSSGTSTLTYIDNNDAPAASVTLTLLVNDNGNTGASTASFQTQTQVAVGASPYNVAIRDVTGDGFVDIVAANLSSASVSVLPGNGSGVGAAVNYATGAGPIAIAVADLNADGRPDLVTANFQSSSVSVLLSNGSGGFGTAINYGVGTNPHGVAIRDLNGDSIPDIAVANEGSNTVSVLLGNGSGGFGAATSFGVTADPYSVAIGDFNGDLKPDLAVAAQNSNAVSILLGTGTGSFGGSTNFSVPGGPTSVAAEDFNGDGKLDLAFADQHSNKVSVLLGTGTGSFGAATDFAVGSSPYNIAANDLNGDGKLDLVVANYGSNSVTFLLGNGAGGFSPATSVTVGGGPVAVAVGDINNDGRLDVATANSVSNNVSVILASNPSLTANDTATIGITPVNDAPVLASVTASAAYTENAGGTVLSSALTVGDSDSAYLASASVKISSGFLAGDILSATTAGTSIAASYNSAMGVLSLSGSDTPAHYQQVLRTVAYSSTSDDPTSAATNLARTIDWQVGDGADISAVQQTSLSLIAIDDGPINTVPGVQTAIVDTAALISGLAVSDVDAGSQSITAALSVAHGTLTISSAGGAAVSGSGSAIVTLTGSRAQINTTLSAANNVVYQGSSGYSGSDVLTLTTSDGGNTGQVIQTQYASSVLGFSTQWSSTGWSAAQTLGAPNVLSYGDNSLAWTSSQADGTLEYLTVGFSNPTYANQIVIRETNGNGFVYKVDLIDTGGVYHTVWSGTDPSPTGAVADYTVTFPATAYLVQGAKVYINTGANSNWEEVDSIQLGYVGTGLSLYDIDTVPITIVPPNAAPVVTAGNTLGYTENDGAKAISSALTLTDADTVNLAGATVTISGNYHSGEDVLAFTNQNGISGTFNASAGTLTLSGTASVANYQAALRSATYANTSDNPSIDARTVSFVADDGQIFNHASSTATTTVTITPMDDAPVNTVPDAKTIAEDTASAITGLSIADVDAQSGTLSTALSVLHGTLTVGAAGGASVSGSGTGNVSISGTLSQINAVLAASNNVLYQGSPDYSGSDMLTMTTNDGGNTGNIVQTQYAGSIIAFSSEWTPSPGTWSAAQVLGAPNTFEYGDISTSWTAAAAYINGSIEYLTVGFTTAAYANQVVIRETCGNGFVRRVDLIDSNGIYHDNVWTGADTSQQRVPYDFAATFPTTSYLVQGARVWIDTNNTPSYEEVDSIQLGYVGTGLTLSDTDTVAITVTPVNDAPVTDLNGGTAGNDSAVTFTQFGGAVQIAPSATITDIDSANLASMAVTLTNRPDGDSFESLSLNSAASAAASGAGLSVGYTASNGVLSVTGSASKATYQTILQGVQYNDTDLNLDTTTRDVNVVINDGTAPSAVNTSAITMLPSTASGFYGKAVSFTYFYPDLSTVFVPAQVATVSDPAEFPNGYGGIFSVDIDATTITVTYLQNNTLGAATFNGFRIGDYGGTINSIVGVMDNSPQVTTTFDSDNVYVNWQGQSFYAGDVITINVTFAAGADPVVLDLGRPGIAFSPLDSGVYFDINADSATDRMAWTTGDDGILAFDLDGSGKIENGSEVFTPNFAGAHYTDGLAALASFDTNHDGRLDDADAGFANLLVWQDHNHDGVSDAGEISKLADHGMTAIDLRAAGGQGSIDGQAVIAEGKFSFADGSSGTYVVADLEAALGTVLAANAPHDANDVLTATAAADVFVFKPDFGHDTIDGFAQDQDMIEMDHKVFADFAAVLAASTPSGSDTMITYDTDNSITLKNIAFLQSPDFYFV